MADKPEIKETLEKISTPVVHDDVKSQDLQDLIAKTIQGTIVAIAPILAQQQSTPNKQGSVNTLQTAREQVLSDMNAQLNKAQASSAKFNKSLVEAPKSAYTTITIPKVYAKYFGPSLSVGINGNIVVIPIDNRPHRILKLHYGLAMQAINYEDEKIAYMEASGNRDIRYVENPR